MPLKKIKPRTPGTRHASYQDNQKIDKKRPEKALTRPKKKITGRNSTGKITVRHRGGAQKRKYRIIDFKRNKRDIPAVISAIEYDPNRGANICLLTYKDGEKRYIIAPVGLASGDQVVSGDKVEIETGNATSLRHIPIGTPIHNLEIIPGKGGQLVRGAGTYALIQSKEVKFAIIQLPSKEVRLISLDAYATIGQVSNPEIKSVSIGKAGRKRHMGWRPSVRGTAQHPGAHPHGGGEGRSGIGLPSPKSPWGKKTLGKKTRKSKKYSDKYIIKDRRKK